MINKPPPFNNLNIQIPYSSPIKGGVLLITGLHLAFWGFYGSEFFERVGLSESEFRLLAPLIVDIWLCPLAWYSGGRCKSWEELKLWKAFVPPRRVCFGLLLICEIAKELIRD